MTLRDRLRKWLGLNDLEQRVTNMHHANCDSINLLAGQLAKQVSMGIDPGFRDDSMIIIMSRLNGGKVKVIDAHVDNLKDLRHLIEALEKEYGARDRDRYYVDRPLHMRGIDIFRP